MSGTYIDLDAIRRLEAAVQDEQNVLNDLLDEDDALRERIHITRHRITVMRTELKERRQEAARTKTGVMS